MEAFVGTDSVNGLKLPSLHFYTFFVPTSCLLLVSRVVSGVVYPCLQGITAKTTRTNADK